MRPVRGPGSGAFEVLLQLRAGWTHEGGCWGLPGGASDSGEDAVLTALREAGEELGVDPRKVRVLGNRTGTDHGDWRYVYVLGLVDADVHVEVLTAESDEARWVDPRSGTALLHPALARDWSGLAAEARRLLDRVRERP